MLASLSIDGVARSLYIDACEHVLEDVVFCDGAVALAEDVYAVNAVAVDGVVEKGRVRSRKDDDAR
jgi:hypothetical protein